MVQFYLNGRYNFIENNIVIGDEPDFDQIGSGRFTREIEGSQVFEVISVKKQTDGDIIIYHSFLDSEGNDIIPQQCKGTECKLGSIKKIDGSPCIYIKKETKVEFDGIQEEHIPVYTVFDTYNMKIKVLDTSTQVFSFSKQKPLKL